MALKSMSIERLTKLRADVEAMLASKVNAERQALESELSELDRLTGGGKSKGKRGGPRGAVAAKYRNPENPSETWAGRGLRPRWLAAALKSGKKLEDFAISAPAKRGRPAGSGRAAKAKG